MEAKDLERLPDPNTYEYDKFYLRPENRLFLYPQTVYYKHKFVDEKGNVSCHWSKKAELPEDARLSDL